MSDFGLEKLPLPAQEEQYARTPSKPASDRATNEASETLPLPSTQPSPQLPDGGFQAWLQCANMFCLWFTAWGLVNSFGVFQAYYGSYALADHSSSSISWIGTLQSGLFLLGATVLGAIVFTLIFENLWHRIGFGWTVRVLAFIVLASLLLPVLTMRKRHPRSPPRALVDPEAFEEPATVFTYASMLLVMMGLYVPYFYIEVFAVQKHTMSQGKEYLYNYLIVFLNVGSFFGRLFPNILADKIGPLNTIIPCGVVASTIGFSWIAVRDGAGTIAFCVLYGFFSGSIASLSPVLWASLCPDVKRLGTRTSMMMLPMAVGLLVGNPIAGALIHNGSFERLQIFCGATVMAATCLLVATRLSITGSDVARKA
ncbi:hypothetical protein B0A55_06559 [Friedmanniomyces simplex]|uniref:Major facilitator superfamily (MFS) profile domain-containing protein n=1 Tax=Friedmanniomyces simplex TaxID=329884 RepID=A0A4V5NF92_9PEZI|nr:hypothetical protein B0A55_06559 [Friedmanniomyces simplex]